MKIFIAFLILTVSSAFSASIVAATLPNPVVVLVDPNQPAYSASERVVNGPSGIFGEYIVTNNTLNTEIIAFAITNPTVAKVQTGDPNLVLNQLSNDPRTFEPIDNISGGAMGLWDSFAITNENAWNGLPQGGYDPHSFADYFPFPGTAAAYWGIDAGAFAVDPFDPNPQPVTWRGFLFQPAILNSDIYIIARDTKTNEIIAQTATVTQVVPLPAAVWLFGSALAAVATIGRVKPS